MGSTVSVVVLDIEGTTGSISHVQDVLFPYARKSISAWMQDHRGSVEHAELLDAISIVAETADLEEDSAVALLHQWADQDVKAPPLKTLQGWIWAAGYANGDLSGHVYPDVPPALSHWRQQGIDCHIYSSGTAQAQRDWFAHTAFGDLTGFLSGYHDLTSAGPKRHPASYESISAAVGTPGGSILFASDVVEELDAARRAGWRTLAVRRPDDRREPMVPGHRLITSFADLDLDTTTG